MPSQRQPAKRASATPRAALVHTLILDSSERLFVAAGYQRTSMDHIAAASGITKPTLYRYFRDKYEIFQRVFARVQDDFRRQAGAVLRREEPVRDVIAGLIDLVFRVSAERRDLYRTILREHHLVVRRNVSQHLDMWLQGRREMIALLTPLLERGLRPEAKRQFGAAEAAGALLNILEGMFYDQLFNEHGDAGFHKRFVDLLLSRGVLAEEER